MPADEPIPPGSGDRFRWEVQAAWSDMDFNRHMGNAAYLDLCTTVRMMHFAEQGVAMAEFERLKVGPVVFRDEIDYHREVHLLERLTVTLGMLGTSADGSHFRLRNEIWKAAGVRAATVVSAGGWFDVGTRRLVRPPASIRAALDVLPRLEPFADLPSLVRG
jgi:acyl-CoA thioester hydrolase